MKRRRADARRSRTKTREDARAPLMKGVGASGRRGAGVSGKTRRCQLPRILEASGRRVVGSFVAPPQAHTLEKRIFFQSPFSTTADMLPQLPSGSTQLSRFAGHWPADFYILSLQAPGPTSGKMCILHTYRAHLRLLLYNVVVALHHKFVPKCVKPLGSL